MIYGSNPDYLKMGVQSKCYFHDNESLSKLDIIGIEETYPKSNSDAALKLEAATLPIVLNLSLSPDLRKALNRQLGLVQKQLDQRP